MKNNYLFIIILTLLFACGKDKTLTIEESYCSPQETGPTIPPYRGPGWGFKTIDLATHYFKDPYMNPNNENEFVYFMEATQKQNPLGGIYIYNMLTKQKKLVLESSFFSNKNKPQSEIRWSRKGWLIFGGYDNNIYKIKPNGDSLIQLTFNGGDFVPEWNYDGTLFITEYLNKETNKHYNLIRDENGLLIDSLPLLFDGQPSWNNEQFIVGTQFNLLVLYDYINKTTKTTPSDNSISFPRWINKNEFIYDGGGIFTYNIMNNKIKQIRKIVNSNGYSCVNLLSNGKMICGRNKYVLLDADLEIIGSKYNICIINPCDTVVTDIDLW
jgi:hypothetical protein